MTDGQALRRWVMSTWPQIDWWPATVRHGAFHEVLVADAGSVARVASGRGHRRRTVREADVMAAMAGLRLPVAVPEPLSPPVTSNGRTGVLVSRVPGRHRAEGGWAEVGQELVRVLHGLAEVPAEGAPLPAAREWCGGSTWPSIVDDVLAPLMPEPARRWANLTVVEVLAVEQEAPVGVVHGDFGLHNVLWTDDTISGLIDTDHACWGDPAIDVAPLVGTFGARSVARLLDGEVVRRAMVHRASLPLQVAAAAELAGADGLRDHAVANFVRRLEAGTSHDPDGAQVP